MRLIKFWYPDSLKTFLLVWQNLLQVIEEDLAVGLMLKLLFVPLFHDSTLVGKLLSIIFRLTRIVTGFFAFFAATILLILIAVAWFGLPGFILASLFFPFLGKLFFVFLGLLIFGLALFLDRIFEFPPLQIYQVKTINDIFKATKLKKEQIDFLTLLRMDEVKLLLQSLEITPEHFSSQILKLDEQILNKSLELSKKAQAKYLTPGFFWVAFLESIPNVNNELLKINLHLTDFEQALIFQEHKRSKWRKIFIWDNDFAVRHLKGVNRGWLSAPTPNLDLISVDLTKEAAKSGFDDFIGRSGLLNEVITILSQENDRNVLLVAPPGAGKSTLVNFLAKMIISGDAPDALSTKRIVKLDLSKIISGVNSEGDLAQNIKLAFEEVQQIQNIIVFIDEIQELGVGEAGEKFNILSLLLPYLESNSFQFIASTESQNYARVLEKHSNLIRIFHKVELPPASKDETLQILREKAIELMRTQNIVCSFLAINEMVELSLKYIHDRVLPDSALAIFEECKANITSAQITKATVEQVFSKWVNVPIDEGLDGDKKQFLLNLEEIIHQKLVDQAEAVKVISDTLRRASTDLREQAKPIGSFLFVGPTGVGKTELARILSETYFGHNSANKDDNFLRFDMSEYQTEEAVNRLIGNFDNPGELTEAVRAKPYCLILLDEFEKASAKILNLFLQVLEDGRLTDSSSRTTDFTNTIIIATSNAASLTIAQGLEKKLPLNQIEAEVKEELLKMFKPELVNRFDKVVIFKPLSEADLEKIVLIKVQALTKTLVEKGYLIEFDPELIKELAKKGFDPILGARPMKRLIQDSIEAKLSRLILENRLQKGEKFIAQKSLLEG